jgi:hypothetical protein
MRARFLHVVTDGGERRWVHERTRHFYNEGGQRILNVNPIGPDPDLHRAISTWCGGTPEIAHTALPPGASWPRIFRPGAPRLAARHKLARDNTVHAAQGLFRDLREVFRYIEPRTMANRRTYGHETRNLLVLACTEVENAWRAVLRENGYQRHVRRRDGTVELVEPRMWNAQADYSACIDALRLHDWRVHLIGRDYGNISPFGGWTRGQPLRWYQAYNAVKHDREGNFPQATLDNCIRALAGLAVMIFAQFGTWANDRAWHPLDTVQRVNAWESDALDTFRLATEPTWSAADWYAPPQLVGRTEAQWRFRRYWR